MKIKEAKYLIIIISIPEHMYKVTAPGPENDRTMKFYNEARVDGLKERIETPSEMNEHYQGRDDQLYFRYVEFGKRAKKFGPAEDVNQRPIVVGIHKIYIIYISIHTELFLFLTVSPAHNCAYTCK